MIRLILSLLCLPVLLFAQPEPEVNFNVTSVDTGGTFYLAAYDSAEDFDAEKMTAYSIVDLEKGANAGAMAIRLPHTGRYVFAAFHDLNGNGELDRNLVGIPKEPYGFVRIPGSKLRSPDFEEVCVPIRAQPEPLRIQLLTWTQM